METLARHLCCFGGNDRPRPKREAFPETWATPTAAPLLHKHFDTALPGDFAALFDETLRGVFEILGGGHEIHVVATHTHRRRWTGRSAKAALDEVRYLFGRRPQLGDYCTFECAPEARVLFLQYDTICPGHRRSVIAHEYFHVHQMSFLFDTAHEDDRCPMWLAEGTAALFEHLFINERAPELGICGLTKGIQWITEQGLVDFGPEMESYKHVTRNYFLIRCE